MPGQRLDAPGPASGLEVPMRNEPNSRISQDGDRIEVSRQEYDLIVWLRRRWPTMVATLDRLESCVDDLESCVDALERREPK